MAKAKKKVAMKDLGRIHIKEALRTFHPFLRKEYRTLLKTELNSKNVFKELFGDIEFEPYKLKAVYEFQK